MSKIVTQLLPFGHFGFKCAKFVMCCPCVTQDILFHITDSAITGYFPK